MQRALLTVVMFVVSVCAVRAEEKPVRSRILSVSMFKNGLAVIKREITVPGPGLYRVTDTIEPVHGTFWLESDANVETRVTTREVQVPLRSRNTIDFQEELAGKEVTIHFRDGSIPAAAGKVIDIQPRKGDEAWNRTYHQPRYHYYGQPATQRGQGRFLILETGEGRIYLDSSMIAYAQVKKATGPVLERKPVLLFNVESKTKKPAVIIITYLAKGIAWAPSYRVDISDKKKLIIEQKAVIKNELVDIADAEMFLISGFPSVQFGHVTSPLSLNTTWTTFFQQLAQRVRPGQGLGQVLTQQRVTLNAPAPSRIDMSAIPSGEGPDIHYQPAGKRTLNEGDSVAFSVASESADYERIVEWIVPDTRRANGQYIRDYERNQNPDKYRDAAWDAVRFRNPLPFPMTTGSAMITGKGHFQGQRTSYWVNKGEQTTLHVTKALSIRTRSVEQEEQGKRQVIYVGGNDYRKTVVKGTLSVSNHRDETVTLVIRRRFSGELLTSDGNPKCVLREEGVWSVNKRNELTWSLTLKPGQESNLNYSYSVLVDR